MSESENPGGTRAATDFALAGAESLLHLQLAVLALAGMHDCASALLAEAVSFTDRAKQTRQILSECLAGALLANETIERAEKAVEPFSQQHRWEVFDTHGKLIKATAPEAAAAQLLETYTVLDAYIGELVHQLQNRSNDERVWELLDAIRSELRRTLVEVCDVFAEQALLDELVIDRVGVTRLAADLKWVFPDPEGPQNSTGRLVTRSLREACSELFRPLVTQITASIEARRSGPSNAV